jgi:hypothetical protein
MRRLTVLLILPLQLVFSDFMTYRRQWRVEDFSFGGLVLN